MHILDDEEDLIELFAGPELPKRDPPRAESERRLARVEPNYIHYFEGSTGVSAEESGKTRSAVSSVFRVTGLPYLLILSTASPYKPWQ